MNRKWYIVIAVAAVIIFFALAWNLMGSNDIWSVCYTGCGMSGRLDEAALNSDKLEDRNHLPMVKFESVEDLTQFKEAHSSYVSSQYDEISSFAEETAEMDEAYFDTYTVFAVEASSGSYRFGVRDVAIDGNALCVHIQQTNDPELVTDDLAGWIMIISVPREDAADCTEFDAKMV